MDAKEQFSSLATSVREPIAGLTREEMHTPVIAVAVLLVGVCFHCRAAAPCVDAARTATERGSEMTDTSWTIVDRLISMSVKAKLLP